MDDDGDAHMFFFEECSTAEIVYLASARAGTIIEKHLSPEERRAFDEAKDASMAPWLENAAWEPVDEQKAKRARCVK